MNWKLLAGLATVVIVAAASFWYLREDDTPDNLFRKFYRVQVSLTHMDNEPITIDYMMGCRTKKRKFFAQPVEYADIRVPMIFGIRTKGGQGILTETPDVCGFGKGEAYDLDKQVPPDFLPINFYAERADDLEFMTAYLSERAYDQLVSKLKFHKATVTQVSEADYETWKKNAPPNIVPEGSADQPDYYSFFNGQIFPEADYRYGNPIECRSLTRRSIPAALRANVQALWPASHPSYWVPDQSSPDLSKVHMNSVLIEPNDKGIVLGQGLRRPNGQGMLFISRERWLNTGLAKRIPVYDDIVSSYSKNPVAIEHFNRFVTMAAGADQGFAACNREVALTGDGPRLPMAPKVLQKVFVDGTLVGQVTVEGAGGYLSLSLLERDEYIFGYSILQFNDQFARQQ